MSLDGQGRLAAQGSRALDGKLCAGKAWGTFLTITEHAQTVGLILIDPLRSVQ